MIDEVRDLLQQLDRIIEAEFLRRDDEIDDLKQKLREITDSGQDFDTLRDEAKKAATELRELTHERDQLQSQVTELSPLVEKCSDLEKQIIRLKNEQEGFRYTVKVISSWVPSQRESIDVLVALASSPNHEASFKHLQDATTIPLVTLQNRVIPLLAEKSLVTHDENNVKLTFTEILEEDTA